MACWGSSWSPPSPPVPPGPNNLQSYPVLTTVTSNGSITHIQGTLNSRPKTSFLIQFFTNPTADPSGYGQGQTGFGSTQVTTDANGNATIDLLSALAFPQGFVLSATATNLTTGDTSAFAQDITESAAFQFSQATYVTSESSGTALITVSRSLTSASASVTCATVTGGTAQPHIDYIPITTILNFAPGVSTAIFTVQILDPHIVGGSRTVNLALSIPIQPPTPSISRRPPFSRSRTTTRLHRDRSSSRTRTIREQARCGRRSSTPMPPRLPATSSSTSRPRLTPCSMSLWGTLLMETGASILSPRPGRIKLGHSAPSNHQHSLDRRLLTGRLREFRSATPPR